MDLNMGFLSGARKGIIPVSALQCFIRNNMAIIDDRINRNCNFQNQAGSAPSLWGRRPPNSEFLLLAQKKPKGHRSVAAAAWCVSIKCSPNHVNKEKFSLSLGLEGVLAEADIFRCTLLGANF